MVRRGWCDRNTGERRLIREFETDEDQGNECSGGVRGAIPHRQANCALVDVMSVSVDRPIVTGIPMIAARKRRTASDLFADFFSRRLVRSFRGPTAQSSVFIPLLSLPSFKRRVCARKDFLNLFHAFCLHV